MQIKKYADWFMKSWNECSTRAPLSLVDTYTRKDKLSCEARTEEFLKKIRKGQNKDHKTRGNNPGSAKISFTDIRDFFKSALNYEDSHLDIVFSAGFRKSTNKFMEKGRKFDPDMSTEDIFQASRNVWIINGIQSMMGLPVKLTPSIFAYSMLYPYTDNYLDDPSISRKEKTIFSRRFKRRINGEKITPANNAEKNIFDLIGIIEKQYERLAYPDVYRSLLAIHDSQTKSVSLLDASDSLSETDVLKICIEKGGTSVLADGYLVSGFLTEAQRRFLFNYGAYLQLADDIQDTYKDLEAGLLTIFSRACRQTPLDELTNRTFNIGTRIMEQINCFNGSNLNSMKSLMEKSIKILIIESIGFNNKFYSKSYTQNIESYSPFRFSYLRKNRGSLSSGPGLFAEVVKESVSLDD